MYSRLNQFDQSTIEKTEKYFKEPDSAITIRDLQNKMIGGLSAKEFAQIIYEPNASLSGLILKNTRLDKLKGWELKQFFNILPKSLDMLDLSGNNLGDFTGRQLYDAFVLLPTLTTLDISHNQLWKINFDGIALLFNALKPGLQFLRLASNGFGAPYGATKLKQIFSRLPEGVNTVDLRNNNLQFFLDEPLTFEALICAIHQLPKTVTYLDLRNNDNMEVLVAKLPEHIKYIGIGFYEKIHVDVFLANSLSDVVEWNAIRYVRGYGFDKMKQLPKIKDGDLNRYMTVLEKNDSSIAYLTGAWLLEGIIKNKIPEKVVYWRYMEKRLHDAASFYMKASCNVKLKPVIEYFLWELKTSNVYPSIRTRLDSLDISPPDDVLLKDRQGIVVPLLSCHGFFSARVNSVNKRDSIYQESVLPVSSQIPIVINQ